MLGKRSIESKQNCHNPVSTVRNLCILPAYTGQSFNRARHKQTCIVYVDKLIMELTRDDKRETSQLRLWKRCLHQNGGPTFPLKLLVVFYLFRSQFVWLQTTFGACTRFGISPIKRSLIPHSLAYGFQPSGQKSYPKQRFRAFVQASGGDFCRCRPER